MMEFTEAVVPVPLTVGERDRKRRGTDKRKASTRKYRHDNSKWSTDATYLSRQFVAYDGEGVTVPGSGRQGSESTVDLGEHLYVMLAVKDEDGGDYVADTDGLGTARIFDFLLASLDRNPDAIHVIYGGGYDFNMWLRDVPRKDMERIYRNKSWCWNGYRIMWRRGKQFYVCRVDENHKSVGKGITIYDVVSFFQRPFVGACDEYLGAGFEDREMIVSNKALRSSFNLSDIPAMKVYNDAELRNLIHLMVELRDRLNKVTLRPRWWYGPGALAAALLAREGVKDAMKVCPPEVAEAARFAFAGGRFEVIRFGHVERPAYEYDVNSAYPSALRNVPDLTRGTWGHDIGDGGSHNFALYHVSVRAFRADVPGPVFRRDPNGTVCYPQTVTNWVWSPEMRSLKAYCEAGWGEYEVLETWVFRADDDAPKPFAFIEGMYAKRRALKKAGDGAHVGLKLALNSLFGKTCQQVGWSMGPKGLRTPPFHQLEWAGYATSHCRAEVLTAALGDLESVVAFETDAVFTMRELPKVDVGTNIGQFERVAFDDLTYVQSGLYFANGGAVTSKTRGVDRGQLVREDVLAKMAERAAEDREVPAVLTRFVGIGVALSQSWDRWRRWERVTKRVRLEPTGKRIHGGCEYDGDGSPGHQPIGFGGWHYTLCPIVNGEHSCEFPIEWVNPNPDMDVFADMRTNVPDWAETEME